MKTAILAVGTLALAACSDATTPASSTVNIKPLATISAAAVVIVTEADVLRQAENDLTPPAKNWMLYVRTNLPAYPFPPVTLGTGEFTVGPDTPPIGTGSFRTLTPDISAKVFLANYDHVGTALTSINGISYSTYKTMGATAAFPAINIQIDIDGGTTTNAGELRTLVFEPVLQPGFVNVLGVWEYREAFNGGAATWWSTDGGAAGVATGAARGCGRPTPCTWTSLIGVFPGATIIGGVGINQGSGSIAIDGSSDALSISYGGNTVTYDFEGLAGIPSFKDDCRNGGWMTAKRADGSLFKNQGDCVLYLKKGK